jgi:exopolysaccharide biosynthesis polyprenyl glycosylphosphotransferase
MLVVYNKTMIIRHTPGRFILFIADCVILFVSLYIALSLRFKNALTLTEFLSFVLPFTLVIAVSVAIFYGYGLYDKPTLRLIRELNKRIFTSQILVVLCATILFYSLPILGIAPKTILLLYVIISSVLMSIWRRYAFSLVLHYRKQKSIIIGSGETFNSLVDELSRNPHIGITLLSTIDVNTYDMDKLQGVLTTTQPNSIIIDMRDERIKPFFDAVYLELFKGAAVLDIVDVYEDVFDMVPLEIINQDWIFRSINVSRRYDGLKRFIDILFTAPLSVIAAVVVYPCVYLAIKIEDGGPILYSQLRIGKHGKPFRVYKFRSMENLPTNEVRETKRVTKVGSFLRKTRMDELPQLWNVIRGDISLIGPRPETPNLVQEYAQSVPFYNVRHIVRPGLSGWAQTQQHEAPKFGVDIKQTKAKLAYDMYYLEHSSLLTDLSIILRTIKVLMSKSGV